MTIETNVSRIENRFRVKNDIFIFEKNQSFRVRISIVKSRVFNYSFFRITISNHSWKRKIQTIDQNLHQYIKQRVSFSTFRQTKSFTINLSNSIRLHLSTCLICQKKISTYRRRNYQQLRAKKFLATWKIRIVWRFWIVEIRCLKQSWKQFSFSN